MRFTLVLLCLVFTSAANAAPVDCNSFSKSTATGNAPQRLKRYIQTEWTYFMQESPEWATTLGHPEGADRWTDRSIRALERREKETKCRLAALKKVNRTQLNGPDRINFDLLIEGLELDIEGDQFPGDFLAISHLGGAHSSVADTFGQMPATKWKDVNNMLARLEKAPQMIAQNETLLREGMKRKVMPVKMFLKKLPAQFDRIVTAKVEDSPIYKAFAELKGELTPEQIAQAQARAKELITTKVNPALVNFRAFLEKEYIPAAREGIAWTEMPNGKEWYKHMVRRHTTTTRTPEEIHEVGLKEVARIGEEMKKVREQVKFKGDAAAFNKFLLTDKQFYYTDKEALLAGYRDIAKRADAEMAKQFKTIPRLPYGVREMPEYKAKDAPTAYYIGGSLETGRAGFFEANTYDLKARPKWGMEALTLHEAAPGHHTQIAVAQELPEMPEFRKHEHYTAFVEGWALYAERLGEDMGFYKDPYSKYGQLSYEMWRAVRLVVDTGMHQFGWSRDKAIDYMMANLPKSRLETEVEIDRYITWPGQALAYKVGEMKIRELRSRAKAELGEKFDVREFHDEVLKNGALPLDVLDKSIEGWMLKKKTGKISKTQT